MVRREKQRRTWSRLPLRVVLAVAASVEARVLLLPGRAFRRPLSYFHDLLALLSTGFGIVTGCDDTELNESLEYLRFVFFLHSLSMSETVQFQQHYCPLKYRTFAECLMANMPE
jgi:hypothetical protein